MKTILLSLIAAFAPLNLPLQADPGQQEGGKDQPPQEKHQDPHTAEQKARREAMEKHLQEVKEAAGKLAAEGKKEEAEAMMKAAKARLQEMRRENAEKAGKKDKAEKGEKAEKKDKEHKTDAPRPHSDEGAEQRKRALKERIEQHMKHVHEEAEKLKAEGLPDQAEARIRQAKERIANAMREEAKRAEAEAGHAERKGDEAKRDKQKEHHAPADEHQRKLHHLEQAIGHLREAGMTLPADQMEHLAARMRKSPGGPPPEARHDTPPPNEVQALRRELAELRAQMQELRRAVEAGRKDN